MELIIRRIVFNKKIIIITTKYPIDSTNLIKDKKMRFEIPKPRSLVKIHNHLFKKRAQFILGHFSMSFSPEFPNSLTITCKPFNGVSQECCCELFIIIFYYVISCLFIGRTNENPQVSLCFRDGNLSKALWSLEANSFEVYICFFSTIYL